MRRGEGVKGVVRVKDVGDVILYSAGLRKPVHVPLNVGVSLYLSF